MKLFILVVNTSVGVSMTDVQRRLEGVDWYRLAANVWVVYGGVTSADDWAKHLLPLVKPGGTLLVSELNTRNHQGWQDEDFWEWFNARAR